MWLKFGRSGGCDFGCDNGVLGGADCSDLLAKEGIRKYGGASGTVVMVVCVRYSALLSLLVLW